MFRKILIANRGEIATASAWGSRRPATAFRPFSAPTRAAFPFSSFGWAVPETFPSANRPRISTSRASGARARCGVSTRPFRAPEIFLRQVAQMPDGRSYLWIARMVRHGRGGFDAPEKGFAVALGCGLAHADRVVYARELDLKDPEVATRIGPGCKVCERPACPQRAFPMVGRPLDVSSSEARFAPYSSGTATMQAQGLRQRLRRARRNQPITRPSALR